MNTYPRRAHFDYFRSLQNPMLGVTVDVDVTALRAFCKAEGCSFYLAFMRCAARAANGVPQLRQRIRDGGIVEYDVCSGGRYLRLLYAVPRPPLPGIPGIR